jgi:hypothetical protein
LGNCAEQLVEQAQQLDIVLLLIGRAFEGPLHARADCLQVGLGVSDDKRADCGAEDDDEFIGLEQHAEMAAAHEIAAGYGAEDDDCADDDEHAGVRPDL